MVPQIERSYYTNSLSLLPIQHPSLKVKVTVRMTVGYKAQTHTFTSTHACGEGTTPQPYSFTIQPWQSWRALWMWKSKEGRGTAAKWKRMTQPWSLVRFARNDLSHSANRLCVLSGRASWSVSLPVAAVCFFFSNKSSRAAHISKGDVQVNI